MSFAMAGRWRLCDTKWHQLVCRIRVAEASVDLSPLAVQFADFAAMSNEEISSGPVGGTELEYWREQLADSTGAAILAARSASSHDADLPRPDVPATLSRSVRRMLYAGWRPKRTLRLCMVLLAAFQVLLARIAREHDVCVGMPIANRSRPEFERLIGFFANTLVIRGRLD